MDQVLSEHTKGEYTYSHEKAFSELVRTACHSEQTYLYVCSLMHIIAGQVWLYPFIGVRKIDKIRIQKDRGGKIIYFVPLLSFVENIFRNMARRPLLATIFHSL